MRWSAATALALTWLTACLSAQEASVLVGGAHARYADRVSGTAAFGAARLDLGRGHRAARAEASYSRFFDTGWAVQLAMQGTALWPLGGGRRSSLGVAAGAALGDFLGASATGTAVAGPLLVLPTGRGYAALGASAGALRRLDASWAAVASGSLRWSWPLGRMATLDFGLGGTRADTLGFVDASAGARVIGSRVRLAATLGARAGAFDAVWGAVDLSWIPLRSLALEIAAGRYPPDPTGFTDGLYLQSGVRLYARRAADPTPGRLALVVESGSDGTVRLVIRLDRAAQVVAIAGEWNQWEPVPMARGRDGAWTVDLRLPAGTYRYAIVVDREWTLPPGVVALEDDFGGRVGVLVVER